MLEVAAVPVLTDNYVWLIHNGDTGETAAVDPSVAEPVLDAVAAKGWSLTQAIVARLGTETAHVDPAVLSSMKPDRPEPASRRNPYGPSERPGFEDPI